VSNQLLFRRQTQPAGGCAGSDDHAGGLHPFTVDAQTEGAVGKVGLDDRAGVVLGAELGRLLL